MSTYYDELEVAPAASADTIQAAFGSLAPKFAGSDPTRMERLLQAYRVLSDAKQRAEYDQALTVGAATPAQVQPVASTPPAQPPVVEGDTLDQFLKRPVVVLLVGQNLEGFKKSWRAAYHKVGNNLMHVPSSPTWSWPASLCGPFYLCYRKMYGFAAAWAGVALLVSVIENLGHVPLASGAYIGLNVFIGMNCKGWYFNQVRMQADKIKSTHTDPSVQMALATSKGGVSWVACIVGGALCVLASSIPDIIAAASDGS